MSCPLKLTKLLRGYDYCDNALQCYSQTYAVGVGVMPQAGALVTNYSEEPNMRMVSYNVTLHVIPEETCIVSAQL